ncbi:Cysteine--tRNA ligase [archaeon HR06]|nr:Cysteine--tRNA ligase [archaeon HR06]
MRIYNTLSKKKEKFKINGEIKIFICGPTVYDHLHLGHARTYIFFDSLIRFLKLEGYKVNLVMNITDIDDSILEKAKEESYEEIVNRYYNSLLEDFKALRLEGLNHLVKVSDYVDKAIEQLKVLMEKGLAYKLDKGIYFDTSKLKDFGKLLGKSFNELTFIRVDINKGKKNPQDFLLWINSKDKPCWDSPWGKGRPYWHLQDTSVSLTLLGKHYDIHGGGKELIYPHHEAQRAIVESLTGLAPKFWIHTGSLLYKGEKMSKSKGNYITIKEALKKYDSNTLRLYFLSHPYKEDLEYKEEDLKKAKEDVNRIKGANFKEGFLYDEFKEALLDDFNFPKAKEVLLENLDKGISKEMLYVFGLEI